MISPTNRIFFLCFMFTMSVSSLTASENDSISQVRSEHVDSLATIHQDTCRRDAGHFAFQLSSNVSHMIHHGPENKEILHSYGTSFYDIRLKYRYSDKRYAPYDRAMNYPSLQVGLQYGDFSHVHIYRPTTPYESRIGYLLTLFGGMQFDFLRKGRWSIGTDLQNGVAYCPHPFNEHDNVDNEIIGSTLSIYVGFGFFARYRFLPHWSMSLGVDFKHISNGTLDRPNIGVNALGATLSLGYDIDDYVPSKSKETKPLLKAEDSVRGFYVEGIVGLGMKALFDDFSLNHSKHNPIYGFFTTMIAPMYRYHLLHASGIGIDYTYADYVYKIHEYDQRQSRPEIYYSPHVFGISLRHEIFYRHISLNAGVGVYLFRHLGHLMENESRLFQTVGLRYSLPFTRDRIFVGYNVKAHRFQKVDCVQLVAGFRLGR